jgi:two-component system chemotaxis response regulator CheY
MSGDLIVDKIGEVMDLKMNILVVDDSSTMRRIITNTLRELGLRHITNAEDGDEALEKFRTNDFDLVLSDHKMPRMSGEELLEHIRKGDTNSNVPFIMITAESFRDNVMKAVQLGVSNYIVKPFTTQQLLEKLLKVFAVPSK